MSLVRVEVLRSEPRPRNVFDGLCGSLDISIEAISYLHIGSKQVTLKVNEEHIRLMLKRYRSIDSRSAAEVSFEEEYEPFSTLLGRPIVPASSVKGNVRARIELSFRAKDGKVRSCFIRAGRSVARTPVRRAHGWRHYAVWGDVLAEDRGLACDLTKVPTVCLVCDMFGTAGLKGLICFSDFVGDQVELTPLSLEYDVRVVAAKPGSSFKGIVSFLNLKPEELGLVLLGMGITDSRLGRPVLLGRQKYKGALLGRVRYSLLSLRLSTYSVPLKAGPAYLAPGSSTGGAELDTFAKSLSSLTLKAFEGELRIVDEVKAIEDLS